MTDRTATSLIGAVLMFVTMWFIPYGMPHGAPLVGYGAFAALTFAAIYGGQWLWAEMRNPPPSSES